MDPKEIFERLKLLEQAPLLAPTNDALKSAILADVVDRPLTPGNLLGSIGLQALKQYATKSKKQDLINILRGNNILIPDEAIDVFGEDELEELAKKVMVKKQYNKNALEQLGSKFGIDAETLELLAQNPEIADTLKKLPESTTEFTNPFLLGLAQKELGFPAEALVGMKASDIADLIKKKMEITAREELSDKQLEAREKKLLLQDQLKKIGEKKKVLDQAKVAEEVWTKPTVEFFGKTALTALLPPELKQDRETAFGAVIASSPKVAQDFEQLAKKAKAEGLTGDEMHRWVAYGFIKELADPNKQTKLKDLYEYIETAKEKLKAKGVNVPVDNQKVAQELARIYAERGNIFDVATIRKWASYVFPFFVSDPYQVRQRLQELDLAISMNSLEKIGEIFKNVLQGQTSNLELEWAKSVAAGDKMTAVAALENLFSALAKKPKSKDLEKEILDEEERLKMLLND